MITITLSVKGFPPVVRETRYDGDDLFESIIDELVYQQHDLLGRTPVAALVQQEDNKILSIYDISFSEDGACKKVKR